MLTCRQEQSQYYSNVSGTGCWQCSAAAAATRLLCNAAGVLCSAAHPCQAVCGVHEQRIVHSDLKPANFLLVEGQLKLIDFGIAKAISGDTTSIARESQVRHLTEQHSVIKWNILFGGSSGGCLPLVLPLLADMHRILE